uniref:Caspase recruitment domain family, member 14 n=1 Tax=Neogobius melanostomus TaxID=47308 RepID=A0A8C6SFZ6_9GOBI
WTALCKQDLTNNDYQEELWELINDNRHRISLDVRPCIVIPYLRQARVLTEMDEDEILSCHSLTNRSMRTSYMIDLLRTQGRNGAVALLDGLMIHYPTLYTQVTGRKPSTEPSRFSGLIKYSELTEYLVRAVTGMQKELQEARSEAGRKSARCTSLETELSQIMEHEEKSRYLQTENERMQRQIRTLQREITKMKDEKCDFYVRYTAAIEEKSAVNMRLHDLTLQAYQSRDEAQAMITRILSEKDCLRSQLVELQERLFSLKAVERFRERKSSDVWKRQIWKCFDTLKSISEKNTITQFQFSLFTFSIKKSRDRCKNGSFLLPQSLPDISASLPHALSSQSHPHQRPHPDHLLPGGNLLQQLSVVGGNRTGVFVNQVTEGSAAHMVGISPGAQIVEVKYEQKEKALRMVLEDSTLEEAVWALRQVTGFCHLSLRPRPDDYRDLLQQLQSKDISSGDSIYVRVNMSLCAGSTGTLAVSCNDILHVTNTWPSEATDSWEASHVHPCQLLHLESGTVPNYFRAQGLLIRALEDMNFQTKSQKVTPFSGVNIFNQLTS